MGTRSLATLRRNLLPIGGFRDPLSVPNLTGWYDLSDASLLGSTHTGTGGVTSGTAVGYVTDKSGNGWHLTQSTANNRPVWSGSINGVACLTFDGSNDVLSSSASWPLSGDPSWTIFVVHTRAVTTSGFPLSWGTRLGGSVNVNDDSIARWVIGAATFINMTPSSATNTGQIASATKPAGRANFLTIFRNGSYAIGSSSITTTACSVAAAAMNLGLSVAGPSYHNGTVGEALIYSRALSTAEHANVVSWLASRWGVTL